MGRVGGCYFCFTDFRFQTPNSYLRGTDNPAREDECRFKQGRLMLGGSEHEHIGEAKQTYELYKEENDI